MSEFEFPEHGGNLSWAEQKFGICEHQWIDLSTGISPWSWPVPNLTHKVWQRLPPSSKSFIKAAGDHYKTHHTNLIPLPGTQFLISRVPHYLPKGAVAIPRLGYKEHQKAWVGAGHHVVTYDTVDDVSRLVQEKVTRYVVMINPNNPTGALVHKKEVVALLDCLLKGFGTDSLMVLDEAFIDCYPDESLVSDPRENLLVLRSLGKFFGLAGLRLGVVSATENWVKKLGREVEPWLVSHPALFIGEKALRDEDWKKEQNNRILHASKGAENHLENIFPEAKIKSCGLFTSVFDSKETLRAAFLNLARKGILTRYIENEANNAVLRFGLTKTTDELKQIHWKTL